MFAHTVADDLVGERKVEPSKYQHISPLRNTFRWMLYPCCFECFTFFSSTTMSFNDDQGIQVFSYTSLPSIHQKEKSFISVV